MCMDYMVLDPRLGFGRGSGVAADSFLECLQTYFYRDFVGRLSATATAGGRVRVRAHAGGRLPCFFTRLLIASGCDYVFDPDSGRRRTRTRPAGLGCSAIAGPLPLAIILVDSIVRCRL
jgi:hypothetical protein